MSARSDARAPHGYCVEIRTRATSHTIPTDAGTLGEAATAGLAVMVGAARAGERLEVHVFERVPGEGSLPPRAGKLCAAYRRTESGVVCTLTGPTARRNGAGLLSSPTLWALPFVQFPEVFRLWQSSQ